MENISDIERLVAELDAIKRLLVLTLVRSGASQAEIAHALGVAQPTVSRLFSGSRSKSQKKPKGR